MVPLEKGEEKKQFPPLTKGRVRVGLRAELKRKHHRHQCYHSC